MRANARTNGRIPADRTAPQRTPTNATTLPRRARTRKGKARLLTLTSLDGRTAAFKSAQSLIATLTTDLGGEDQLSAGERQLVMRAALVGAIVADFETKWVAGECVALSDYLQAVNVQRRVLATLGLKRIPRNLGPTLSDFLPKAERHQ